jgi:intracellular sulfur oxidation DsrE/DsrF family protein
MIDFSPKPPERNKNVQRIIIFRYRHPDNQGRDGVCRNTITTQTLDTYLKLLMEYNRLPAAICFYTEGVKLVVEGSPFLERFAEIEKKGVRLIICSTCLNYYGLLEKVRVGIVGGMPDILEAQSKASKVITV